MYAVLSPAKRLNQIATPQKIHRPTFWSQSRQLAKRLKGMSVQEIRETMSISQKLGELNHQRFQDLSMKEVRGTPAIHTFAGDTYIGLKAEELSEQDISWAQDRIGILSGFYGILRPLDSIEPYRLEMGTALKTQKGKDLYAFWNESVLQEVEQRLKSISSTTLINLASKEYFTVLKGYGFSVINPIFKEEKNGAYKVVALKAKRARGSMARFNIDKRATKPEELKEFTRGGYRYSQEESDEQNWVFLR